jgi:hypothetical protein
MLQPSRLYCHICATRTLGSSNLPSINFVSTQPGATALILALEFNLTISFLTPLTNPYIKPALPLPYSACPSWPNFPHSLPVTTIARWSISLPAASCDVLAERRKCLMVRKQPLTFVEYTFSHSSMGRSQMGYAFPSSVMPALAMRMFMGPKWEWDD